MKLTDNYVDMLYPYSGLKGIGPRIGNLTALLRCHESFSDMRTFFSAEQGRLPL